jgi:hypothetical protein
MRPLTEQQVRRSFVNCSKGEANGLALPKGFDDLNWAELEVLGWRDPKAPLRGYLVLEDDDEPLGSAVRAADTRMAGDAVSLFTAERAAELHERVAGFVDAVRR